LKRTSGSALQFSVASYFLVAIRGQAYIDDAAIRSFISQSTKGVGVMSASILFSLGVACLLAADEPDNDLMPPVRVEAAGKPIDTEIGHAAPFVGDFDGDGKFDLLVGQFGGGTLAIYRNIGTNAQPEFAAGEKFQASGKEGRVPSG
jgi:hypothetical protein